jgi:hypothetical protein
VPSTEGRRSWHAGGAGEVCGHTFSLWVAAWLPPRDGLEFHPTGESGREQSSVDLVGPDSSSVTLHRNIRTGRKSRPARSIPCGQPGAASRDEFAPRIPGPRRTLDRASGRPPPVRSRSPTAGARPARPRESSRSRIPARTSWVGLFPNSRQVIRKNPNRGTGHMTTGLRLGVPQGITRTAPHVRQESVAVAARVRHRPILVTALPTARRVPHRERVGPSARPILIGRFGCVLVAPRAEGRPDR